MTDFQKKCIETLANARTKSKQTPIDFSCMRGKKQEYLYAKIPHAGKLFELYIYQDEAGCMQNESSWKVFEKPDFSNPDNLIQHFVAYVMQILS